MEGNLLKSFLLYISLKFIHSEKATKIWQNFTFFWAELRITSRVSQKTLRSGIWPSWIKSLLFYYFPKFHTNKIFRRISNFHIHEIFQVYVSCRIEHCKKSPDPAEIQLSSRIPCQKVVFKLQGQPWQSGIEGCGIEG